MRQKAAFALVLTLLCILCIASASAMTLAEYLKKLPPDNTFDFKQADVRDWSVFQTWSRWQPPTGACTAFSMVAAVEAVYTRKYCFNQASELYKRGYCERCQTILKAKLKPFHMVDDPFFAQTQKDLDLSELYFMHRVLTAWTASPTASHESGTVFCHTDGVEVLLNGDASLILCDLTLPEESQVEWIYDEGFYKLAERLSLCPSQDAPNRHPTQANIDMLEFTETKYDMKTWDNKPLRRPFIPLEGRQSARFGVKDMVLTSAAAVGDKVKFLEKSIFIGHEVAVDGAVPGHSMLLIGYDRPRREFFFKDHYHSWRKVPYDTVVANAATFTIVMDVRNPYPEASLEEMWMGEWEMVEDSGKRGRLVIRRTRPAPNAFYTNSSISGANFQPISTTLWARVGTLHEGNHHHVVYGRLNGSNGSSMELSINPAQEEGPPDPLPVIRQGYNPKGPVFYKLRLFTRDSAAAVYAVGEARFLNGSPYGVWLKRPRRDPRNLGNPPSVPSFSRSFWSGNFTLQIDGIAEPVLLTLNPKNNMTLTGAYGQGAAKLSVNGRFVADNHVALTVSSSNIALNKSLDLYFHRKTGVLISGTMSSLIGASMAPPRALFGRKQVAPIIRVRPR